MKKLTLDQMTAVARAVAKELQQYPELAYTPTGDVAPLKRAADKLQDGITHQRNARKRKGDTRGKDNR